jgi:hypothetical protein
MKCKNCFQETNNPKFCSRSCSVTFNNIGRRRHGNAPKFCLKCNKKTQSHLSNLCNKCKRKEEYDVKIEKWLSGEIIISGRMIKRYLQETISSCSSCGLQKTWNNKPIVLEIEHIDGNSENNRIENLTLLCPNCHSQTPTFKGRNKGNGRLKRREIYQAGVAKLEMQFPCKEEIEGSNPSTSTN